MMSWDFPGGAIVKTLHFYLRGMGSIPGKGTKIPHAGEDHGRFEGFGRESKGSPRRGMELGLAGCWRPGGAPIMR